ncbi:mitotic spindle assembly checkpoint protein MAD1-like [Hyposmocoma kahamanoa]|uniref:mitotic spindle assembly checkpoint protein MAD1-like n=1 Tax=Hyposmocoma kahamanoa TaxID=1477025 RepID=UPI000E6D8239|nr:mitotic spindle assembly checkpoint protein MAD1-like [Hyposmocoma kahamanoa]
MAKEVDMSLFSVLEPFRRVINTDQPKVSASTKLNFSDNSNQSIKDNSSQSIKEDISNLLSLGKRKLSLGGTETATPEKRNRTESTGSASVPPSPWEAKRLKIDLIAAKAQITKLEARVSRQHTIRKEMQILFEEEKASLMEQHKRDERALSDMDDRLQLIRRREQELKDEFNEVVKEHKDSKAQWEKDKAELQKQIADLKDKLLEANVSSKDQVSEMKKDMDELLQALEGAQSEIEMLKKELAKQTSRAEQCTQMRTQLEKQTFELQQVSSKLKELEYERDSYKDWQQQAKTAQKRLSNMAELEKEVTRLRQTERSLRDAVCNKLLLEEQVHILTTKVESLQPVQQELHEAKVKIACLESSLEDWIAAARAHGVETARALSSALDSALSNQLTAVANNSQVQSQFTQLTEEVASAKYERDKATSKLNDLLTVRKNHENLIHRLQKRLLLVTRERDSYRQQLDCYEKELTVTLCGETGAGSAALLSARVEHLEKALQGYRDLVQQNDNAGQAKESSEEYLTFQLSDDGIEMVHTEYSSTLGELVELHLHHHRSIPVFLSALTMELFTRTTMQQQDC